MISSPFSPWVTLLYDGEMVGLSIDTRNDRYVIWFDCDTLAALNEFAHRVLHCHSESDPPREAG